jgi:CHASE2 domain-containing sensor protein
MEYHHLDLCIDAARDGVYSLRASCKVHGESQDVLALTLEQVAEARANLEEGYTTRGLLETFGDTLYRGLFETPERNLGSHFYQCVGAASGPDQGVLLRLRIEPPEIAALPWEYLFSRRKQCFLASSVRSPVVRYLELQQTIRELRAVFPLRMLVVVPDGSGLDAEKEKAQLFEALKGLERKVEVVVLEGSVTRTALTDALRGTTFHILHFIGHGDFDGDRAFLLLNGRDGSDDYVDHERFGGFVLNHPTLKLVVLNACKGGSVSSSRSMAGMAPHLVRQGVPAVVAMQYAIFDDEALGFAREFYHSLFQGHEHGRVEIAMTHARNLLASEFPHSRAVGAPVLFMHAPEGVLFEVAPGNRLRDRLPALLARRQVHTARAVLRTREHNIAVLKQHRDGDDGAETAAALRVEVSEAEQLRRRLRFGSAALVAAMSVVLLAVSALWVGVFNQIPLGLRLEAHGVWLADGWAPKSVDPRLELVGIDRNTELAFGGMHLDSTKRSEWRAMHGRLLRTLSSNSEYRPRVVVFDFSFDTPAPDPAADAEFARAIEEARASGTQVVVVIDSFAGAGEPYLARTLLPSLPTGWGHPCMGIRRSAQSAMILPVLIRPAGSPDAVDIPSLALRAAALFTGSTAWLDVSRQELDLRSPTTRTALMPLSDLISVRARGPRCSATQPGDLEAQLFIDYAPLRELRRQRTAYEDIVRDDADPELLRRFRDKLVLVGAEVGDDVIDIRHGPLATEERFGYMVQADAINTLLQGRAVRPLRGWPQMAVFFMLAMAAALLVFLLPARPYLQFAGLAGVLIVYFVAALSLYASERVLLPMLYDVTVLFMTFALVRTLQRRWFA